MAGEKASIKVVENALEMLEVLSETSDDWGVTQLSRRLGMHKSRVFKLLATFERRGYIERGDAAGRYRAGLSAFATGRKFLHQIQFLQIARPAIDYLARACNEAAYLAVADGESLLLLESVEPSQRVQVTSLIGKCYPVKRFLPNRNIFPTRSEANRSVNRMTLRVAGELIVDRGGLGDGIVGLTMPVLKEGGMVWGGVCLVVPEYRTTHERMEQEFLPHFREAGRILAAKLDYAH